MKSERRWCAGRDGIRRRRRWRCGRGSCWPARTAGRTPRSPTSSAVTGSRSASGATRFAAEGLVDAPKPGAARTISDEVVEAVVVETLETTPKDATHWSTRSIAQRHGISRPTVSETWRAFGLKPWRQDEFKISPDPDLIEKNRDLVGLYLWLLRHSRFHFHFTPTYGSWMNRRAMVLSPDHQDAPTLRAPQRPSARPGHPRLGRDLERQPPTLHLAQERRGDPRPTRRPLPLPQQLASAPT
jgi:hypothetical protein